jgi:hypothetical protein
MKALSDNSTIAAYAVVRNTIFSEYLDNRLYLIDLYMDAVGKVLAKEAIKADVFIDKLINFYLKIINLEQQYFLK